MALIYVWGFNVDPSREQEFVRWLDRHEDRLAASSPRPYEYLGTYLPVWGGQGPRCYHQMWRYGKGGAGTPFDLRSAAEEGDSSEFTDLARDFLAFVDESRSDEETFVLYRSVTEIEKAAGGS